MIVFWRMNVNQDGSISYYNTMFILGNPWELFSIQDRRIWNLLTKPSTFLVYACMMYLGNMPKDFVPIGKEEQAEIKNDANAQKVATLAGIDCKWMIMTL